MKKVVFTYIFAFLVLGALAQNRIDLDALKRHLYTLSADSLQGRRMSSEGSEKASNYLVGELNYYALDACRHVSDTAFTSEIGDALGLDSVSRLTNVYVTKEGADPLLKDEWIVVLAHYDALGLYQGEVLCGANDNASSVAALLEMARVLKAQKRSVLILFTDGEELGLLGSTAFLKNCPIDRTKIKCAVNVEMIGRVEQSDMVCYAGLRFLEEAPSIMSQVEVPHGLQITGLNYNRLFIRSSDCLAFLDANIPTIVWCTDDMTTIHKSLDTPQSIDYNGLGLVTEHILRSVEAFANAPTLTAADLTNK